MYEEKVLATVDGTNDRSDDDNGCYEEDGNILYSDDSNDRRLKSTIVCSTPKDDEPMNALGAKTTMTKLSDNNDSNFGLCNAPSTKLQRRRRRRFNKNFNSKSTMSAWAIRKYRDLHDCLSAMQDLFHEDLYANNPNIVEMLVSWLHFFLSIKSSKLAREREQRISTNVAADDRVNQTSLSVTASAAPVIGDYRRDRLITSDSFQNSTTTMAYDENREFSEGVPKALPTYRNSEFWDIEDYDSNKNRNFRSFSNRSPTEDLTHRQQRQRYRSTTRPNRGSNDSDYYRGHDDSRYSYGSENIVDRSDSRKASERTRFPTSNTRSRRRGRSVSGSTFWGTFDVRPENVERSRAVRNTSATPFGESCKNFGNVGSRDRTKYYEQQREDHRRKPALKKGVWYETNVEDGYRLSSTRDFGNHASEGNVSPTFARERNSMRVPTSTIVDRSTNFTNKNIDNATTTVINNNYNDKPDFLDNGQKKINNLENSLKLNETFIKDKPDFIDNENDYRYSGSRFVDNDADGDEVRGRVKRKSKFIYDEDVDMDPRRPLTPTRSFVDDAAPSRIKENFNEEQCTSSDWYTDTLNAVDEKSATRENSKSEDSKDRFQKLQFLKVSLDETNDSGNSSDEGEDLDTLDEIVGEKTDKDQDNIVVDDTEVIEDKNGYVTIFIGDGESVEEKSTSATATKKEELENEESKKN